MNPWQPGPFSVGPYSTVLPADQEEDFQKWAKATGIREGTNTSEEDYDSRALYLAIKSGTPQEEVLGVSPFDGQLHATDRFKTPFHETFSNESIYATPQAPYWENGMLVDPVTGKVIFDERLYSDEPVNYSGNK